VLQHHPHRPFANLRRELVRRLARHRSSLSGVGASGKTGAVQELENSVGGLLRGFGLRVPTLRRGSWADAVPALVDGHPTLCGRR
jgi:hypothetical protein